MNRALKIAPHVFAREFDGELVLLDLERGEYFGLDAVGATVWEALGQDGSIDRAVDAVVAAFEVSREQADADIRALVDDLLKRGILLG